MGRHTYIITVDTNDTRPHARRRQGLELARAIHNGSIRNVQVFDANGASVGDLREAYLVRYNPKEPIDRQLED